MGKIRAADLIAKFQQAKDEKWGYIYGASGQKWTQAKQNAATREQTVKWGQRWVGKTVADCSGLFVWAFKQLGGSIYHGSNTIWKKYCSAQGKITADSVLKPGTAVFLCKGNDRHHIGLYIGEGWVIEAKGTYYGVVRSKVSAWHEWGELKDVDYEAGEEPAFQPLKRGDSGERVTELQTRLLAHGYDLSPYGADGQFGAKTQAALKAFQKEKRLPEDGICDQATWTALCAENPAETEPDDAEKLRRLWAWYLQANGEAQA